MRLSHNLARTALALFGASMIFGSSLAAAQSAEEIEICVQKANACRQSCMERCGLLDFSCREKCRRDACADVYDQCLEELTPRESAPTPRPKPKPQLKEAPRSRAAQPEPAPPAPTAAPPAADERVLSLEAPAAGAAPSLTGKILFLTAQDDEPEAIYYGYLLLGKNLSQPRRNAVAEAIACRLEALPTAAAAEAVERLGLFSLPALREAGATRVSAQDVLEAYDFERAEQWLRAAGAATGRAFDPDSAIVFVGSRFKRALHMDGAKLPSSSDGLDPVVADASALSATFAAAWVGQVVDGLETGRVKSRQELQSLMEATSWLDWANQPLLSLFKVGPKPGELPPSACPT